MSSHEELLRGELICIGDLLDLNRSSLTGKGLGLRIRDRFPSTYWQLAITFAGARQFYIFSEFVEKFGNLDIVKEELVDDILLNGYLQLRNFCPGTSGDWNHLLTNVFARPPFQFNGKNMYNITLEKDGLGKGKLLHEAGEYISEYFEAWRQRKAHLQSIVN
jgi:hypothetical protein